jgi:adenosylhomocysteine nucleosidase
MHTWLLVAAERREFDGLIKRLGASKRLDWPVEFAVESQFRGDRWWMVANGPGREAVQQALESKVEVSGIVSTGFCGALDPALHIGDIVENGLVVCLDRVAVTAAEKAGLRRETGAAAVDMESAAVASKAREWSVPFRSVRAVSDLAAEDMPLDFNLYRDARGRFSRTRIALAAVQKPFTAIPALMRLDRNCRIASESLGEFFVNRGL